MDMINFCIDHQPDMVPVESESSFAEQLQRKVWPVGTALRVRFLNGAPAARDRVARFAPIWSQYANITFVFCDDPAAEIRVSFHLPGSWSLIGTDALNVPPDQPTINFGWLGPDTSDDEAERVVVHEFGHVLGLIHEHQNPACNLPWDRGAVFADLGGPPNNWTTDQIEAHIFQTYGRSSTNYKEFDRTSIMMFPIPAKWLTDGRFAVGINERLSEGDKQFISRLYPSTGS